MCSLPVYYYYCYTRRMQRGLSVSVSDTTVSPAKTGEPIEMPSWPLENRALHHLHGVSTLREWAIFRGGVKPAHFYHAMQC